MTKKLFTKTNEAPSPVALLLMKRSIMNGLIVEIGVICLGFLSPFPNTPPPTLLGIGVGVGKSVRLNPPSFRLPLLPVSASTAPNYSQEDKRTPKCHQ